MTHHSTLARVVSLAVGLMVLILALSAVGVGFDGIGDGRWAIVAAASAFALCWFDRPPVAAVASRARPGWGWPLSGSGWLLALSLPLAWLTPRPNAALPDSNDVETWLRDDATGADWPRLRVHGRAPTRQALDHGAGDGDDGDRSWSLTADSPTTVQPGHDPPIDEPTPAWAMPSPSIRLADVPADRQDTPWSRRTRAMDPDRLRYEASGMSIGAALLTTPPTNPFRTVGVMEEYRIAKPFTRDTLAWSTNAATIRGEAGHLLPSDVLAAELPPDSVPMIGLNTDRGDITPLVPVLVDDRGRLATVRTPKTGSDQPIGIDLLGEGGSETGPAILDGWLREARSRSAASPSVVVLLRESTWRRPFLGMELVRSRGNPRPSPRPVEDRNGWEIVVTAIAVVVLARLAHRGD